jgi:hypothetical protein
MSEEKWVNIDFKIIRLETADSFNIRLEDGSKHWIPKSQVFNPDDYCERDRNGAMSITASFAKQKGIGD